MTSTTPVPRGSRITVRPAAWADKDLVLAWRNEPGTRAASLSTDEIDVEAHACWFADVLRRGDRLLFVAEEDGRPVATVRFDALAPVHDVGAAPRWRVSLTVDPARRGEGLGGRALEAALTVLRRRGPATIQAEVRLENVASCRLFAAAGFATVAVHGGVASLRLAPGERPRYPRDAEAASSA